MEGTSIQSLLIQNSFESVQKNSPRKIAPNFFFQFLSLKVGNRPPFNFKKLRQPSMGAASLKINSTLYENWDGMMILYPN